MPTRKHPIRRYCERQGISHSELARRAGISQALISRYVTTNPDWRILPGRDSALALVRATNGEIGLLELFEA